MALTWKQLRNELELTSEEEQIVNTEKELIKTFVKIREEKGVTQSQLADMCHLTQPVIARMESATHSPRVESLLKVLLPLGYTLQIVPMEKLNK